MNLIAFMEMFATDYGKPSPSYTTEIIAREMEMLGGKKDSGNYAPNSEGEEPPLPEDVPF